MKLKGITDVFFDLDHTLWDFEKNSALTFKKLFKVHKINIDVEAFSKHYQIINANYWKLFRDNQINKFDLRYKRLKDTFTNLNIEINDTLIHKLSDDYIKYLSTFTHLLPGTFSALEYLKPNYRLHIITNGFDNVQRHKLSNSKLEPYFDVVVTSETTGVKKPNPKIFQSALELTNSSPKQSVMIGDSLEADIEGALAQGIHAIYYNPLAVKAGFRTYYTITDINQIKKIL